MLKSLLLLLIVLIATASSLETHMGGGTFNNPFNSPLSYDTSGVVSGGSSRRDKKLVSNRRKADKIVDTRAAKAKEIAARKKKRMKAWGIGATKKDGEAPTNVHHHDAFDQEEMETLFLFSLD